MSQINKFLSGKSILTKVYRDLNLQAEDRFYDMLEWMFEGLEAIGVPMYKIPKACELEVLDYKSRLPIDFDIETMIEFKAQPLKPHSGVFGVESSFLDVQANFSTPDRVDNGLADYQKYKRDDYYEIVPGYIKTSFKSGTINMGYLALPVDSEGYPLIPDEYNCREALVWFIIYKLIMGGYDHKVLKLMDAYSMWEKYCMQARSFANMPDLAQLEKLKIQHLSLVPNTTAYNSFFETLNKYPKL